MDLDEAMSMGRRLLDRHGLEHWDLRWDRAKRRAGMCRFDTRVISLSRYLTELHDAEQVRDTVLHEIAHALAGPDAGHGPQWRAKAELVGANPRRTLPPEVPLPDAPWQGRCPGGHEHVRFRRPTRPLSCSRCCPRFCLAHLITWTNRGEPFHPDARYHQELRRWRRRRMPGAACPRCGRTARQVRSA
ncbi:MAG TPA: SprT-like domain-containing protein [Beutenbergiaceae bacterium]|nr:SprT-like domain-containing protein [Beutenbergiaceae bacterium]